jgi:hypothetical protein
MSELMWEENKDAVPEDAEGSGNTLPVDALECAFGVEKPG